MIWGSHKIGRPAHGMREQEKDKGWTETRVKSTGNSVAGRKWSVVNSCCWLLCCLWGTNRLGRSAEESNNRLWVDRVFDGSAIEKGSRLLDQLSMPTNEGARLRRETACCHRRSTVRENSDCLSTVHSRTQACSQNQRESQLLKSVMGSNEQKSRVRWRCMVESRMSKVAPRKTESKTYLMKSQIPNLSVMTLGAIEG